jgi:adenylate cyclase
MSDLTGYTALSARDEKQALLLAALLHRNAERVASAHHGRLVKSIGDAVMLEFPDARNAARALMALHGDFPAACHALGVEALPVHSGAHIGEVVVARDGDLFGQTVNLAARIQGEAKAGQIVVSDAFISSLDSDTRSHRALGARRLRNVPEPMECHELLPT